jgi:putative ABC transport system permease protein
VFRLALRNIFTRRIRSLLALVGLSVSVTGLIVLISLSAGLRKSVNEAIAKVEGLAVVRKGTMGMLPNLPSSYHDKIKAIPGIRAAVPETWAIAPEIEGKFTLTHGAFSSTCVYGMTLEESDKLRDGGVFGRAVKEGRRLDRSDTGTSNVIISRGIAEKYRKTVGSEISLMGRKYVIVGIYETGARWLDTAVVMSIDSARLLTGIDSKHVNGFYVEAEEPGERDRIEREIEAMFPDVDALRPSEYGDIAGQIALNVDLFLAVISLVALVVAAIGILNTMLMSVMERVTEFGILKANGWTRGEIARLVLTESACLGILGGVLGCLMGLAAVKAVAVPMGDAFEPVTPLWLLGIGFGISVILGMLGGLYPARAAAKMSPMEAIRFG